MLRARRSRVRARVRLGFKLIKHYRERSGGGSRERSERHEIMRGKRAMDYEGLREGKRAMDYEGLREGKRAMDYEGLREVNDTRSVDYNLEEDGD